MCYIDGSSHEWLVPKKHKYGFEYISKIQLLNNELHKFLSDKVAVFANRWLAYLQIRNAEWKKTVGNINNFWLFCLIN